MQKTGRRCLVVFVQWQNISLQTGSHKKRMSENVYIAGLGVISAIGSGVNETLASLENHQAGIGPITSLETIHKGRLPVAEVKQSNAELARLTGLPEHMSRTALLSLIAAKEAYDDARL